MCNGLDAISSGGVSTGIGFRSVAKPDLHSAMLVVKRTNKRCWDCYVLERDRFGGGSFAVWGGKWVTRRRTLLSCKTISMHYTDDALWPHAIPYLHYFYCARLGFMVQCFLVESNSLLLKNSSFFLFSFFCSFFLQIKWYTQEKLNHDNKYWCWTCGNRTNK